MTSRVERMMELGTLWEKYGKSRIYFGKKQLMRLIGLEIEYNKSGSRGTATLAGEEISHSLASRYISAMDKMYFDIQTGEYSQHDDEYAGLIVEKIEEYLTEAEEEATEATEETEEIRSHEEGIVKRSYPWLPKELKKHAYYYPDQGYVIMVVPRLSEFYALRMDRVRACEIPCPVRYVLSKGYKVRTHKFENGKVQEYVVCDVERDAAIDKEWYDYED